MLIVKKNLVWYPQHLEGENVTAAEKEKEGWTVEKDRRKFCSQGDREGEAVISKQEEEDFFWTKTEKPRFFLRSPLHVKIARFRSHRGTRQERRLFSRTR